MARRLSAGVSLKAALAEAVQGLRVRRWRSLLTALGIALGAAMLAAATVVSVGLGRGFDRAARTADLPDIIARFDSQPPSRVAQRIAALPDVAAFSLRSEVTGVELDAHGHDAFNGAVEIVGPGRRGFAIVGGRIMSDRRPGEVVVERGLAQSWGVRLGSTLQIGALGTQRVVGFSESPDNVSFPLAVPRVYVSEQALEPVYGRSVSGSANIAQIWLRDPKYLDEVLVQARATSYGLRGLQFVTRSAVRVLLSQAAGIVIDLLVALSLIALATAAVMLAASARAEVQRRLTEIGVRRAVGASRAHLAGTQALEAMLIAAPAATLGLLGGTLATSAPTSRLLTMLNEPPPGIALAGPLLAAWAAAALVPVAAAAWPAWRAAGRTPVQLLRGAELSHHRGVVHLPLSLGLSQLGARLVVARRARWIATTAVLGLSTAFVLLMLALASSLSSLETDPAALGKRFQLTASLPASATRRLRSVVGVQAAAPRYEEEAVDSFALDEPIDVIGYPGNHTVFEAPPLVAGGRIHGAHQAEVGEGLADALGLSPGATLAIQLPSGREMRLRVVGVVSSLSHSGRVAYVPASALLAADPSAPEQIAIRLRSGASAAAVNRAVGSTASAAAGAVVSGGPLVSTLRSILVAVAIVDGLVCLYALIQACALTVHERRPTVSVLRAFGGGGRAVGRLLSGAVLTLLVPAAVAGILLERLLLGPAMSSLAASYASLSLTASTLTIIEVLAGLSLAGAVAVAWVSGRITREPVTAGLGVSA